MTIHDSRQSSVESSITTNGQRSDNAVRDVQDNTDNKNRRQDDNSGTSQCENEQDIQQNVENGDTTQEVRGETSTHPLER